MPDSFEFTKIHSVAEDPIRHRTTFQTDSGRNCWLSEAGAGKLDRALVRKAAATDQVVFVAFDSKTGACMYVTHFNRDHVKDITVVKGPEAGLEVTLVLRQSILLLPSSHPRFSELSELLERARKQQELVWIGTYPGDSKIKDVQIPEKRR
jgi:hypothetical protein